MRYSWLALPGVLLATAVLFGQQPSAAPAPDPSNPQLDEVLGRWEKAMSGITSLVAQCTRTSIDKTYQTTDVFEGVAKYLKTNHASMASLEMRKKGRPDIYEKYICSGTFLYEFASQSKVIRIHELPKPASGQVTDDNFLSFLFGMKADESKRRYQLTLMPPPANDKWYSYVDIRPRSKADMADFTRARLVLINSTNLPRQLWFEQPNSNEVIWDFPQLSTTADLRVQEFAQPPLPASDWQYVRVPRQTQARVIRQQD